MGKKKIVIITDAPAPYRVDLFVFLQRAYPDYEFHIIFCNRNSRVWNVALDELENPHYLQSLKIKYPTKIDRRFLVISHGMTRLLNQIRPDVIVASEYNQTVQTAFTWARLRRIPFVSWTDGTIRSEKDFGRARLLMRHRIISKADSFIASSSSSRELQIKYGAPAEKTHVSYLTVKTDAYQVQHTPKNDGVFRLLFVGRLVKGKGLPLLFDAMKHIQGNWHITMAGDGPERENLEALAAEYQITDKVTFTGFLQREALTELYAQSDLFVHPTLNDCFGLVILEAMCAGLPVITTIYADGAPDLIENGISGIILDPNDTEVFAGAIQKCIDDPEFAAEMGRNALARTEIFHFRNVAVGYMAAIEEALNR